VTPQEQNQKPTAGLPADEAFDPWEQSRPIPLFVIAVVFALGLWGLLTYGAEYLAHVRAGQQHGARARVQSASSARIAAVQLPDTPGIANGDPATLALVGMGKGPAWSCASCHGAAGEGSLTTPRLAGQPAAYLKKQLQDFASGQRSNESMALVARTLSAAEMDSVARYYAGIDLHASGRTSLGGDLARGEALARHGDWKQNLPACFSCHGTNGEGVAPGFPALAGQKSDYIFAQLAAWHAGERKNSPQALMDGIARNMSPQDMRSVADYLASMQH
jgi:cytochrome c553